METLTATPPQLFEADCVKALAALAQTQRLRAFRALVVAGADGLTPGVMAEQLGVAPSALSFHLKELAHSGLVSAEARGRNLIYRANFDQMNGLLAYLSEHCCGGETCQLTLPAVVLPFPSPTVLSLSSIHPQRNFMSDPTINVLFLCTHNSARSIMAEALLNHLGNGRFKAYSAGSSPRDNQQPNPLGLETLKNAGVPIEGLRSKNWDEFAVAGAPHMDLVITVCDNAAGEVCPFWPGQPATAHWSYADPSEGDGDEAHQREAFRQTLHAIRRRLDLLVNLPTASVARLMLQDSARGLSKS